MPIFDDNHVPKRIILGGDVNILAHDQKPRGRARAKAILDVAESFVKWGGLRGSNP